MAAIVAGMLIGPVAGASVAYADSSTPSPEVRAAVDAATAEWQSSLGVRHDCSSGVSIVYDEIDGRRGEYRTASSVVAVDPTDGTDGLEAIVIHELSHHTFLACGVFADADFKQAFYAAQGIPSDRDWFDYAGGWSQTPAEHFAEAMATAIVGNGEGGIPVGVDTVAVVTRWLAGAPLTRAEEPSAPTPYSSGGISTAPVEIGGRSPNPEAEEAPAQASEAAAAVESPTATLYRRILEAVRRKPQLSVYWLNWWRTFARSGDDRHLPV
jgi:hypothetical protein